MPLHEKLWTAHSNTVSACLEHPFVKGIGDGTLPESAYRRYVGQDAYYLRGFFRAYALAAARLESLDHLEAFHVFMRGALDEITKNARSVSRLGIDLDRVEPYDATRSYVGHLEDLGGIGTPGEILSAMTPCMRLYAHLGVTLRERHDPGPGHPYREWIETYSRQEFLALCDRHDALLDELAGDTVRVRESYAFSMHCELAFFQAVWRGE